MTTTIAHPTSAHLSGAPGAHPTSTPHAGAHPKFFTPGVWVVTGIAALGALVALARFTLGLGATNPPVTSGAASPSSPLAQCTGNWRVIFGTGVFVSGIEVIPSYVGLVPGFIGLYQINVQIPANSPKGEQVAFFLQENGGGSQQVLVAVQ